MHRRPSLALITCLALAGCSGTKQPATDEPSAATGDAGGDVANGELANGETRSADEPSLGAGPIGKELPPELVGELRSQGSDADGRLLTLASGFIATAECSDCGAPSYLWFLAVRCADSRHCEVLTEQCEGEISREDDTYSIELRPVEGGPAQVCAGYSGTFELP